MHSREPGPPGEVPAANTTVVAIALLKSSGSTL